MVVTTATDTGHSNTRVPHTEKLQFTAATFCTSSKLTWLAANDLNLDHRSDEANFSERVWEGNLRCRFGLYGS